MRRLFPNPAPSECTVLEAYDLPRPRPADRPWVTVCMVASVDGSTVVEGRSKALGSATDTEVLLTMRSLVDVVLVGAGTVRAEGYGPPRRNPDLRIGVVSRSGDGLDFTGPLFASGRAFMVVPDDAPDLPVPTVRAGRGTVDLAAALAQLDARVVQSEGGPSLNGALAAAGVIDEVTLTIAPLIVGGRGPRVTDGAPDVLFGMRLDQVMEDDGFLFTRYLRDPQPPSR